MIAAAAGAGISGSGCSSAPAWTPPDPVSQSYSIKQEALYHARNLDHRTRDIYVSSLSLRIHVKEAGSGQPLLMIHGGNGVGAHWLPVMPHLRERRLIAPDRPGCGLSDPLLYDGVDMRVHGSSLIEDVMNELGIESASLIGNSMGGYYSLCFALDHPNRIDRLIVAGGPAGSAGIPPLSPEAVEARVRGSRQPGRAGFGGLLANPARMPDDLLELCDIALGLPGTEDSWRSIWRNMGINKLTFGLRPELRHISTPTLFVWGEQDRIDPPAGAAQAMADSMPKARLVLLPDAGHLPWIDKPEECASLINGFLA